MKLDHMAIICIVGCLLAGCSYAQEKEIKKVSTQEVTTLPDETESKAVVDSGVSTLYTDQELLDYANEKAEDYFKMRMSAMCGQGFDVDVNDTVQQNDVTYCRITNENIQSLDDIYEYWSQYFSEKYGAWYQDVDQNVYGIMPYIEMNKKVYAMNKIDGIVGSTMYFDHITMKSDDEVWFEAYWKSIDDSITDANQQWSFVYENGPFKYGTVIKNEG